jgi:hypothetical protein
MKTVALSLAGILGLLLTAPEAQAIPRTFVSHAGGGTACTRAAGRGPRARATGAETRRTGDRRRRIDRND